MNTFQSHSTKDLISYYNEGAAELGKPPVSKFQDRATAERRCDQMRLALRQHRAINTESVNDAPIQKAVAQPKKEKANLSEIKFESVRDGSKRAMLIAHMTKNLNAYQSVETLSSAVYGSETALRGKGAVLMVLKGLQKDIVKNSVPVELRKQKDETGVSSGLFETA